MVELLRSENILTKWQNDIIIHYMVKSTGPPTH